MVYIEEFVSIQTWFEWHIYISELVIRVGYPIFTFNIHLLFSPRITGRLLFLSIDLTPQQKYYKFIVISLFFTSLSRYVLGCWPGTDVSILRSDERAT